MNVFKDEDGMPLVTKIRDSAGQKGTGKWTAISALDHGVPVTLIAEAVFARWDSSHKLCSNQATFFVFKVFVQFARGTSQS